MESIKLSTVLLLLILACLVTGVRADSTLTALIISSCVSGLLILLLVLGSIIYCVIRYQRKQDYLNKSTGPLTNGHYRPMGIGFMGEPSPSHSPGGRRAKAYTQHPPVPRHRPPLTFYTVRADPRDVGLTPPPHAPGRAFPLGGAFVTAPPNFGRPVLYLDMLDAVAGPKMNGTGNGFLRRYIPKHATPEEYFYVNGNAEGHPIRAGDSTDEQEVAEERYRRKEKKKSRGRSKSLSRGGDSTPSRHLHARSRSRSRDATSSRPKSAKAQQPVEETPVLAIPGDIILTDSNVPRDVQPLTQEALTRSYSQPRVDDPGRGFTTTTLQQRRYTLTFDHDDAEQEYDDLQRSDIYYLPSNRTEDPFEAPSVENQRVEQVVRQASHFIPVSNFRMQADSDSEAEPEPTPRADYMEPVIPPPPVPPVQHPQALQRQNSKESDPSPTPVPDYSARPVVSTEAQAFTFSEVRQTHPAAQTSVVDGRDSHADFEAMLNSVNLSSDAARRQRPPTPPFDGEITPRDSMTFSPPRPPTLGQLDSLDARIPTPPPDIPSPMDDDDDADDEEGDVADAGGRFGGILAARPPTPPPGKLLRPKEEELGILQDLQEEGARARQLRASSQSSQSSLPALPFMAELKRRQRDPDGSDDEDPVPPLHLPPTLPAFSQQERGDYGSRALDAVLSLDPPNAPRGQMVSFTPEPPEIIPHVEPASPLDSTLQQHPSQPSSSAFAPPPPPPPPPPLPPPPPMS